MHETPPSWPGRIGCFLYGAIVYILFLITFSYLIGFVGNLVVPRSIDTGEGGSIGLAIVVNALLLSLFAIQHTIMARPGFKEQWTKIVPAAIERSTYVLATCIVLGLMVHQWRAMPEVVWSVENAVGRMTLYGLFTAGWVLVLYSSFCIDHFDLFGLRQVVLHLLGKEDKSPGFVTPWLYKIVRNPLMLGFLLAFWCAPVMTQGHLLFSILVTGYIFAGIQFEERDLLQILGEDYRRYRERTPMLFPFPWRGVTAPATVPVDGGVSAGGQ